MATIANTTDSNAPRIFAGNHAIVLPDGKLIALYQSGTTATFAAGNILISSTDWRSTDATTPTWSLVRQMSSVTTGWLGSMYWDAPNNRLHVIVSSTTQGVGTLYSTATYSGGTWVWTTTSQTVTGDSTGCAVIQADPNGLVHVVYRYLTGTTYSLRYTARVGGTWQTPAQVSSTTSTTGSAYYASFERVGTNTVLIMHENGAYYAKVHADGNAYNAWGALSTGPTGYGGGHITEYGPTSSCAEDNRYFWVGVSSGGTTPKSGFCAFRCCVSGTVINWGPNVQLDANVNSGSGVWGSPNANTMMVAYNRHTATYTDDIWYRLYDRASEEWGAAVNITNSAASNCTIPAMADTNITNRVPVLYETGTTTPWTMNVTRVRLPLDGRARFKLRVPSTDAYSEAVLADCPAVYYRCAEVSGTTLVDSSGNGNDGTLTAVGVTYGQPGALAGNADTSLGFDGSTGYGTFSADPSCSPENLVRFSVELWMNPTAPITGNYRLIANGHTDTTSDGMQVFISATTIHFTVGAGTSARDATVAYTWTVGEWYHIVGTYDSATINIHVNGTSVKSIACFGPVSAAANVLAIGRNPAYNGDYFQGAIDEVAFYTHTLDTPVVLAHYLAGSQTEVTSDASARFCLFGGTTSDVSSRVNIRGTTTNDALARLKLGLHTIVDTAGRIRVRVARLLDASARVRVRASTMINATARFKAWVARTRDVTARASFAVKKTQDGVGRFSLGIGIAAIRGAWGRVKVRAATAADTRARFKLALPQRVDLSARFLLRVAAAARDVAARLKIGIAASSHDGRARLALRSAASREIVGRINLWIARTKDGAARLQVIAQITRAVSTRFSLAVKRTQESVGRLHLRLAASLDARARFAVGIRAAWHDGRARLALIAQTTRSGSARFALLTAGAMTRDGRGRFKVVATRPALDGRGRWALWVARSLDTAARIRVRVQTTRPDGVGRLKVWITRALTTGARLALRAQGSLTEIAGRLKVQVRPPGVPLSVAGRILTRIASHLEATGRVLIAASQIKEIVARLALRVRQAIDARGRTAIRAARSRDLVGQWRLRVATHQEGSARVQIAVSMHPHAVGTFTLLATAPFRDAASRFVLAILGGITHNARGRIHLRAHTAVYARSRFCLVLVTGSTIVTRAARGTITTCAPTDLLTTIGERGSVHATGARGTILATGERGTIHVKGD